MRGRLEGRAAGGGEVRVRRIGPKLFCSCWSAIWVDSNARLEVGVGWVGTRDGRGRTEMEEPDGEVSLILSSRAFSASCRTVSTETDPQVFSSFTLRAAAYAKHVSDSLSSQIPIKSPKLQLPAASSA